MQTAEIAASDAFIGKPTQGGVSSEISRYEAGVSQLEDMVKRLHARLEPVLSNTPQAAPNEASNPAQDGSPIRCAVADAIQRANSALVVQLDELQQIMLLLDI